MDEDIEALIALHGGYWGEHPDYPHDYWIADVIVNETRNGYWEWVEAKAADA